MPTYDYECEHCGHRFEQFQSIKARPLAKCPSCARPKLKRLIGAGGGLIFKGSGFYLTDYRSESYKQAAQAEQGAAKADGKPSESAKPEGATKPDAGAKPDVAAKGADGAKPTPAQTSTGPTTKPTLDKGREKGKSAPGPKRKR